MCKPGFHVLTYLHLTLGERYSLLILSVWFYNIGTFSRQTLSSKELVIGVFGAQRERQQTGRQIEIFYDLFHGIWKSLIRSPNVWNRQRTARPKPEAGNSIWVSDDCFWIPKYTPQIPRPTHCSFKWGVLNFPPKVCIQTYRHFILVEDNAFCILRFN